MMKKTLVQYLGDIEDYRSGNAIDHKLIDILVIAILGVLCGADGWTEIQLFGESKKKWLKTFLDLPNGIPSHDTFGRVFARIDPEQFHNSFVEWVQSLSEIMKGQVVSIDGKTARGTKDKAKGKRAIHVVSAWANANKLVLGQRKIDDKSNEITAIPELLRMLDVSGCIVTIDAMGTQKTIAKEIIDGGADYVLSLKKNQGTLYEDVELFFKEEVLPQPKDELKEKQQYFHTLDKDHGRLEKREYYVIDDIDWLSQRSAWPELQGIGLSVLTRTVGETTSVEYHYDIHSIKDCTAEAFGKYKRSHWGIENSLHWVLDIAFREDESRCREGNSAENLNILRHMTLNLLKQEQSCKRGIKAKRLLCGWDTAYLTKVLGLVDQL